MAIFYLSALLFVTVASLIFSLLGFAGKNIILDDAYLKASKEEREAMDKKAYRIQGAIIFLFIFVCTLCNLLRAVLHLPWLTYHTSRKTPRFSHGDIRLKNYYLTRTYV